MALSNCRSNGQGLRLRYRLEVFGYASDDTCASGATPLLVVSRRSVAVHAVSAKRWSSIESIVGWLVDAIVFQYKRFNSAAGLTIFMPPFLAVLASLQT